MKSLIASLFTLLYLVAMTRPIIPLVDYLVNQDFIAEFLCINKEKVELNCKGKCYLMQQLQKQQDEKRANLPRIAMEDYPIGFASLLYFQKEEKETRIDLRTLNSYKNHYDFLYSYQSFHPPASIV